MMILMMKVLMISLMKTWITILEMMLKNGIITISEMKEKLMLLIMMEKNHQQISLMYQQNDLTEFYYDYNDFY